MPLKGYNFYSVLVDSRTVPQDGVVNFYVTGWANDNTFNVQGFFVGRGSINITEPKLEIDFKFDIDVSSTIVTVCVTSSFSF